MGHFRYDFDAIRALYQSHSESGHSQAPKKPMGVLAYAAESGECRVAAPGEG